MDLEAVAAVIPDGFVVVDDGGWLTYVNPLGAGMIGRRPEDCVGRHVTEFVHPDDLALAFSSLESCAGKDRGTPVEVRMSMPDGTWRWMELIGRDCRHVEGVGGILCTARDLTERRMWEVAASDVARFQQVVHYAAAVVAHLRSDGVVTSVNGAFGRILGYDPAMVVGAPLAGFAAPGYEDVVSQAVAAVTADGPVTVDVPMRHAARTEPVPIRLELVDMRADPVVEGIVVTGQDVTGPHQSRLDLEHLATHDALTGLANRTLLDTHLQLLLERERPLSVIYIDLDGFKELNDRYGHAAGDELLCAVAGRLCRGVAGGDMVARRGGDEFVVVAEEVVSADDAARLAERLAGLLAAPYQLAAGEVRIEASAGAAWWAPEAGPHPGAPGLLAQADAAMYVAKSRRRS
ncbi:MAG TPA: diguanylate cyclase, partial [Acidimicrobiales bacterium]|nr:diguanylate cyclase [Acidimicrobiales bacterium]